ncbi:VOC family protein [Promicromonospora thailandica]|uniref:Glyoxalase-like domain-containing protein n=1 Tax=Promicromonospora thailandica TaxID=765201 RepID=A0A9X2JUL1_9MICO|nr:VOC family protein [Promicromonospora thailandica]MCP2263148.1 Glyoxalase-like domain-containing protein [Promicromonospora thailandica]BFF18533.1 VOC family protein [Promicromonospora thailandica]
MADAEFKDLVIDATHGPTLATFWSAALGLRSRPAGDSSAVFALEDDVPRHMVWINQVPEPRTVKQRVHLDLHATVAELEALGATADTARENWVVMRDPEGGELCAFPDRAAEAGPYRLYALVVDSVDAAAASAWWGRRLGLEPQELEGRGWYRLGPGGSLPWQMLFIPVPEPKTVKNRIHWDVVGDTGALLDAGATLVMPREDSPDPHVFWDVLADPEGNEFCVFAPDQV